MVNKEPALQLLRKELSYAAPEIRKAIANDSEGWWVEHHFYWGMGIRNLLREHDFGEEYFHVDNLDDIYVSLVEEALKEQ